MMLEIINLPGSLIGPREGARFVDKAKAKSIADSIKEVGLLSPIIVAAGKRIRACTEVDGWDILAGQHRFHAMHTLLNWREIPCIVCEAGDLVMQMIMIDENLIRHELSVAEKAQHTARRKELYEALHPETANGALGRGHTKVRQSGEPSEVSRFTKATAEATGQSERTVQRDAHRGEELADLLPRIKGTSLDRAAELDALVKMDPGAREELVQRAARGEDVSARNVRPFRSAADPLQDAQASEKQVARLMDAWNAAGSDARDEFLLRIDQPVMDRRFG